MKYDSTCVPGTYFSESDGRCIMDDEGVCPHNAAGSKPPEPPNQPAADPRCSAAPNGANAQPNSCTAYVQCRAGVVQAAHTCPAGEPFFDPLQRRCVAQPPAGCEPPADERCRQAIGYSAVTGSCTRYVYCVASQVRSEMECRAGEFFDDRRGRCGVERPSSCPAPAAAPAPVERCRRAAGRFREPGSCTKYVYCIKRVVRFEYECEAGWHFSELDDKCLVGTPADCS